MKFLREMTAMKFMILLCVVAAGVLGWFGWEQHQRVKELRGYLGLTAQEELKPAKSKVEEEAENLQMAATNFTALTKELEGDNLRGANSPMTVIRGVASNSKIALGAIDIDPRESPGRGFVDKTYAIKPKNLSSESREAPTFQRTQLANFMFKLEEGSKRVKVTNFRISQPKKSLKPEEIPNDRWAFTATVTIREKETK